METLLAVVMLIQKTNSKRLFQQMIANIILLVGLAIVGAILVSAMLIAGFAAAYSLLIAYAVPPYAVTLILSSAACVVLALFVLLTLWQLRRLREMPRAIAAKSPILSCATDSLDAFINGLMAE